MNWTPIITPKKGQRVLVWVDLVENHVFDRSYADFACWDGESFRHGHGGEAFDPQPTTWAPSPDAPVSD